MTHKTLVVALGILVACIAFAPSVSADESASFKLYTTSPNDASTNTATSANFILNDSGVTWHQYPSGSSSFELLHPTANLLGAGSSSSSSSSSTGGGGGSTGGGGTAPPTGSHRGENGHSVYPPQGSGSSGSSSSASSTSSSSISSSAQSSSVSPLHPAPTPGPQQTPLRPGYPGQSFMELMTRFLTRSQGGVETTIVSGTPLQFFSALDSTPQVIVRCTEEPATLAVLLPMLQDLITRTTQLLALIAALAFAGALLIALHRRNLLGSALLLFLPLLFKKKKKKNESTAAAVPTSVPGLAPETATPIGDPEQPEEVEEILEEPMEEPLEEPIAATATPEPEPPAPVEPLPPPPEAVPLPAPIEPPAPEKLPEPVVPLVSPETPAPDVAEVPNMALPVDPPIPGAAPAWTGTSPAPFIILPAKLQPPEGPAVWNGET